MSKRSGKTISSEANNFSPFLTKELRDFFGEQKQSDKKDQVDF